MAAAEPVDDVPASRTERVERLCEFLYRSRDAHTDLLCDFSREFLGKVLRPVLADRSLEDLAAMVTGAFRFLEASPPDGVSVEVANSAREGWSFPVTLIRAELRDRPFIVDTIREYLKSEHLPVEHYVYRVVGVKRDASGKLVAVGDPSTGDARSLVHCEVPPIDSAERREAIRRAIE